MTDLDDDHPVDDAFVLVRWLHELASETPNPAVVASLEAVAEDRGWHPYDAYQALIAAPGGFAADLHPRGKDGKFIEKFGIIELTGPVDTGTGSKVDATGKRGQVTEIIPDPNDPGNPTIRVELSQPDGTPAGTVEVKPNQVSAAPEKARLDTPAASYQNQPRVDAPGKPPAGEFDDRENFVYNDPDNPGDVINTEFDNPVKQTDAELDAEIARMAPIQAEMDPDPQVDAYVDALNAEKAKRADRAAGTASDLADTPAARTAPEGPVPLGGPNNSSIPPVEAERLAGEVMSGNPIEVNPPDVDDVIDHFADSDSSVDLTLLPQFSAMRGNGRPRAEMPQIPKEHLDTFKKKLKMDGYTFNSDLVDPSELQATQAELDGKNVGGMMRSARDGTFDMLKDPIWISNDGHVLDGHHRWAAATALATNCQPPGCVQMPVIRVDMPMDELLGYADQFNDEMGVERLAFGTSRPQPATPGGSNFAAPATAASGMVAASTDGVELTPEEQAMTMATDTEDGVKDEDLANLPHGDGSAFPKSKAARDAKGGTAAGGAPGFVVKRP